MFKNTQYIHKIIVITLILLLGGCSQPSNNLLIYSGKGLKFAVDEIIENFKKEEGVSVSVVYAGSKTLLDTIRKTHKGDIYIPGSNTYITDAGDLITRSEFVAYHVPTFVVSPNKSKELKTFEDLLKPGVRIAAGNKRMAAIGRVTEQILKNASAVKKQNKSIVITASTVNELLQLVAQNKVDAALIWRDMMKWDAAIGLTEVKIPDSINKIKKIFVGKLSTTTDSELAERFLEYATSKEGRLIFQKHGFEK